jgi:hypothetical protein
MMEARELPIPKTLLELEGNDLVQGHYLARLMPGVEVDPLLENRLTF